MGNLSLGAKKTLKIFCCWWNYHHQVFALDIQNSSVSMQNISRFIRNRPERNIWEFNFYNRPISQSQTLIIHLAKNLWKCRLNWWNTVKKFRCFLRFKVNMANHPLSYFPVLADKRNALVNLFDQTSLYSQLTENRVLYSSRYLHISKILLSLKLMHSVTTGWEEPYLQAKEKRKKKKNRCSESYLRNFTGLDWSVNVQQFLNQFGYSFNINLIPDLVC